MSCGFDGNDVAMTTDVATGMLLVEAIEGAEHVGG